MRDRPSASLPDLVTDVPDLTFVQEGDWVTLLTSDDHRYVVRAERNGVFQCHLGKLPMSEIVGEAYGKRVRFVWLLRPSPDEWIRKCVKRATQIMYPKDSGYLGLKLGIFVARRVLEVGTGSGALAATLAMMMNAPGARLVSYDVREDFLELARKNLSRLGLSERVELRMAPLTGTAEYDAAVVDVRDPTAVLSQVWQALRGGAPVGILVPTVNQVVSTLSGLGSSGFADTEAVEILLRHYKTVPERVRPEDRMTAHTGYLIFARKVIDPFESQRDILHRTRHARASTEEKLQKIAVESSVEPGRSP
ncbi:MAG: tRNA (adenine-N1)-methyltransferase [bacterium JZ-2024 1]